MMESFPEAFVQVAPDRFGGLFCLKRHLLSGAEDEDLVFNTAIIGIALPGRDDILSAGIHMIEGNAFVHLEVFDDGLDAGEAGPKVGREKYLIPFVGMLETDPAERLPEEDATEVQRQPAAAEVVGDGEAPKLAPVGHQDIRGDGSRNGQMVLGFHLYSLKGGDGLPAFRKTRQPILERKGKGAPTDLPPAWIG